MKLKRELRRGMRGPDVLAVKRALRKAGLPGGIVLSPTFGSALEVQLRAFQQRKRLRIDGVYGATTHAALWPYFDRYGRWRYARTKVRSREDVAFDKLVAAMRRMSEDTPGYLLGGGHGLKLWDVSSRQRLDCSSSTSKALFEAGMFPDDVAWVSGKLAASWGAPGRGERFTVYANDGHVFVRLHRTRWWRFDTSPQGDGGRGPQLRYLPRFTFGFAARHWPGM